MSEGYLRIKLDFPTPLSPIRITLKMWSYVTAVLSARATHKHIITHTPRRH